LRKVSTFSIILGMVFLSIGVSLFLSSNTGTQPEKVGIVFMMYAGVMLGIGFTAFIALKST
jgi:hypothetical protein